MEAPFTRFADTIDYPVYVVTTTDGREQAGCLVGFTTQTSIHPPRFLVCLSKVNRTTDVAADATVLVVHLVDAGRRDIAELFGSETGDEVDKFAQVRWHPGPGGVAVLDDCPRWFAGRILDRVDLGDHVGHLVEPFDGQVDGEGPYLTFRSAKDIEAGHPA